ncbi:hypothetical protein T10_5145 [Trichinella papuae]|uniref:Uncharacterized protein n=1 Tax=Trichinella papuae TaxID=268474 RepID=A0A0V1N7G4_9BILA|nr:hypothetical protein T10_5145 [Trichinella papuae]
MIDRKGQNILAIEHQNGKYSQKKIDVLNMMTIFATFEKFGGIWENRANEMPYLAFLTSIMPERLEPTEIYSKKWIFLFLCR